MLLCHDQFYCKDKDKVALRPRRPTWPELIPVSVAWSNWEYGYSPLDGMLVHRRVTLQQYVASTHLYAWVQRDIVKLSVLSKETTRWQGLGVEALTFRSEVQCANHYTTNPHIRCYLVIKNFLYLLHLCRWEVDSCYDSCGNNVRWHRNCSSPRWCQIQGNCIMENSCCCALAWAYDGHDFHCKFETGQLINIHYALWTTWITYHLPRL